MKNYLLIVLLTLPLLTLSMTANAIEEPSYTIAGHFGDIEERLYAPYLVAEVRVSGSQAAAGSEAFPILAGYIFGRNKRNEKMPMTAPVTQVPENKVLPMTAPVIQNVLPDGYLVQFVLPRAVTRDTAPVPLDSRVTIREVAARHVAVIRYSGFWTESNYNAHLKLLQDGLKAAGRPWTGNPIYARYNAPFVPWFMRRNEIWLVLA